MFQGSIRDTRRAGGVWPQEGSFSDLRTKPFLFLKQLEIRQWQYFLNLFSPETYEAFTKSGRDISGFRLRHENAAARVRPGDKLVCYMTKLSRWVGILEVNSSWFKDETPIFYQTDDPFFIRFKVNPLALLTKEKAIPIHNDRVWNALSFTRGHVTGSWQSTGAVRTS